MKNKTKSLTLVFAIIALHFSTSNANAAPAACRVAKSPSWVTPPAAQCGARRNLGSCISFPGFRYQFTCGPSCKITPGIRFGTQPGRCSWTAGGCVVVGNPLPPRTALCR